MLELVFDVETTGLLPPGGNDSTAAASRDYDALSRPFRDAEQYPHRYVWCKNATDTFPYITQLSWVLVEYDRRTRDVHIKQVYNEYIRLPDGVIVPDKIQEITGITTELCRAQGVSIVDALAAFAEAYFACDTVVAHNITFDRSVVRAELERHKPALQTRVPYIDSMFHPSYDTLIGIHHYDTMIRTIKACQLYIEYGDGKRRLKTPKLVELYRFLFSADPPPPAHNAVIDTMACMRCYLKFRHRVDIDEKTFADWTTTAVG